MRRRDQTVCSVLPAVLDVERVEDGFGMKNASDEANAATARMQERWKIIANNGTTSIFALLELDVSL